MNYISGILLVLVGLFSSVSVGAQMPDPVDWSASLEKLEKGVYQLKLTADIEKNWVIYSQFLEEGGPIPTTFEVELPKGATLIDGFIEPTDKIEEMDPLFDMKVIKYKGPASFTQMIKSSVELTELSGTVEFMTCDNDRCLPPRIIDFQAELK